MYDVIVVGAGHAGIEAALASARLGCKTIIFTINMDSVGNCPCNPSIGGTAKGHLVREIDALGGEMGKTADECFLQTRMLNKGKGPAVHSLRMQIDRRKYSEIMKHKLEKQENLELKQAEVVKINTIEGGWELTVKTGCKYKGKTVVIATGTYLNGKVYIGEVSYESGPDGIFPSRCLGEELKKLGLPLRRFKTGTPARVLKRSIDFSKTEEQRGDDDKEPFSYETETLGENKVLCHISWTNEETKKVIKENIHRSPLYSGEIKGKGPRYCPSIEDKIIRFADKERHQIFIEPCGLNTEEMYIQGLSTSLPEDVQEEFYHTIKGLEKAVLMRPAYAIEYDCVDPQAMDATLEFKNLKGLFGAGQFNGSSGYEEAAAQGLVAGINAAKKATNKEQIVFERSNSYIGTLIDDLVTKGVTDPYRMMTSRSEYRLILRQDNADERLTPIGKEIGLITEERWSKFQKKANEKREITKRLKRKIVLPSKEINAALVSRETSPIKEGIKITELLKRPQVRYEDLKNFFQDESRENNERLLTQIETEIKYEGYIKKQQAQVNEAKRLERKKLSTDINYFKIRGLKKEAAEKLNKLKPLSIGQASRISGVSPADITILIVWLKTQCEKNREIL